MHFRVYCKEKEKYEIWKYEIKSTEQSRSHRKEFSFWFDNIKILVLSTRKEKKKKGKKEKKMAISLIEKMLENAVCARK